MFSNHSQVTPKKYQFLSKYFFLSATYRVVQKNYWLPINIQTYQRSKNQRGQQRWEMFSTSSFSLWKYENMI